MEQLDFITKLLGIEDKNIKIDNLFDAGTHKEILAHLDYDAPPCPACKGQMAKYDFQKPSKIPNPLSGDSGIQNSYPTQKASLSL